ncbi:MAG: hypothetical protein LPK02_07285 [Rhodobacterales bacterium]|nr:hypothetical protein [Rhodobacterales bacterium]
MEKNTALVTILGFSMLFFLAILYLGNTTADPRVEAIKQCNRLAPADRPICFAAVSRTFNGVEV